MRRALSANADLGDILTNATNGNASIQLSSFLKLDNRQRQPQRRL